MNTTYKSFGLSFGEVFRYTPADFDLYLDFQRSWWSEEQMTADLKFGALPLGLLVLGDDNMLYRVSGHGEFGGGNKLVKLDVGIEKKTEEMK